MQTTVIWLSLFVLFLVIEIITMGLTTIWFAGGALVAFLVAVLGLGLGVQIIIFAIVSLALLAVTRPLAMKYFNQERQKTGAELLIRTLDAISAGNAQYEKQPKESPTPYAGMLTKKDGLIDQFIYGSISANYLVALMDTL